MRHFILTASILALAPLTTWAACPDPVDISADMKTLFEQARSAPNQQAGRAVSDKMWQVWLQAPDAPAQELLDRGMRQRESYNYAGAFETFDRLATYCPTYAEGFNQRAFVSYLRGDFPTALLDLDAALALQPDHVAAQSGRALTLMQLGRIKEARVQMLIAVENNPWLSEKALLSEGAPLGPVDKEL